MGPVKGSNKKRKRDINKNKEIGDWWFEFSNKFNGPPTPSKGLDLFKSVFKISRKTFSYICSLVREDMEAKTGQYSFSNGNPLSLNDYVAVALRRLSSGDSLLAVGDLFGLGRSTVSHVTWRFVESMERQGLKHLQWPSSDEEIIEMKSKFEKIQGFPNCCGAIDTTHITMCVGSADPNLKEWRDYQNNHSMLLQGIVGPDMRFRDVVAGWPGKMSDSLVLKTSSFFELCEKGKRLSGRSAILPLGYDIREYIVGDESYPLLPWLITPYRGKCVTEIQNEFNKRHYATRIVARRALARVKDTWKIIHGTMWMPDKHKLPSIILVCCILHNIIIDMEDEVLDELPLCHSHDPGYRQQTCKSVDVAASEIRDKLCLYLSGRLSS